MAFSKKTKTFIAGLLAATSLTAAATCKNDKDIAAEKAYIARKTSIANTMIPDSLARCKTGADKASLKKYSGRLRAALTGPHVHADALEILKENKITVCLDQRLTSQKGPLSNMSIDSVYYSKDRVVGVWDSAAQFPDYRGQIALNSLAAGIYDGSISAPTENPRYAYSYYRFKGGYKSVWTLSQDFDQRSLKANPQLKTPPLSAKTPAIVQKIKP